ncbi:unnamed protein product [marine sediment metagenome]|uniref:Uncharacterized protein n=1 Tax=marine sediment metagenome TaxID=412755 RepID=X0SV48_9ZZZZ
MGEMETMIDKIKAILVSSCDPRAKLDQIESLLCVPPKVETPKAATATKKTAEKTGIGTKESKG